MFSSQYANESKFIRHVLTHHIEIFHVKFSYHVDGEIDNEQYGISNKH
jgi:hypothetical protein